MARPRGGDWLEDDILSVARQGFDVIVSLLEDDETEQLGLAEQGKIGTEHGVRFIRIPIPDRSVPSLGRETSERSFICGKGGSTALSNGFWPSSHHCREPAGFSGMGD